MSNSDPMSEEKFEDHTDAPSPWIMLCTMLLLIAGLLFASMLLMRQALEARSETGEPVFQPSQLVEKGQSLFAQQSATKTASVEAKEQKPSAFESIKQAVMNPSSEKVRWPRLKLAGFGKSTDGSEGFAIINGDLTHPGEFAGKVKLVEVRTHDVVVEYKGERKTLTVEMED